ncbi:MAG: ThuA domain-containing protein [Planctomycetes bacterium]|nr:ThuA domain-containing protein [Planctomycetota bacterium]
MLRSDWIVGIALVLQLGICLTTSAAEPPVVAGLDLWLDAAAAGRDGPDGKPLARWQDGSPRMRSAVQLKADNQPKLVKVAEDWVVRFDGEDDHLRVLDVKQKLQAFTLFVVAAPHSNHGFFRGVLAFNQADRRDYESGFTLDMNAPMSTRLDNVNLEGRGFGGARNLLKTPSPFGTLRSLECVADPDAKKVRLVVDGQPQLDRDFVPADLIMDDVTVGARFYTNEPDQPQQVRGFFHGDLAEVLLYDRVLTDAESRQIREYLDRKHAALREALPRALNLHGGANAEPLVAVTNPPPIQMLVPGFSVFELPVDLPNINNVQYRADGQLYALGYNGDVWLLSDKDGDGLEETATRFFDSKGRLRGPIGMAVIPAGHALLKSDTGNSRGIVVPSKGKVSAILDHDGDDVADEERVIASGWKEIAQNVDAIGAAIGPDGSIYFGLGTAQYDNAYLIDKDGKAHYDIRGDHGTIQRISPDLSKREIVCTGVRFTIGMAMKDRDQANPTGADAAGGLNGDLYVTDQEGATWLPNGNPYDELLWIERGRHYGFPPRHPRHNPNAVDTPSLFDYGPQHQSTCGLAFNQPRRFSLTNPEKGRHTALFGPEGWAGNAFVTGESRGKLYRTEIHRGQIARTQLIACLSMLTIDCCLTPQGGMVVACHSGGPDWGSGPSGKGKLFQIRYTNRQLAQPVSIWAAGPREVRVAFDRPLVPSQLKNLDQTRITYGAFVAAGDRFETLWPGYAVVQMQKAAPRYNLPVRGVSVTPDRQTLVFATEPHPVAWQYALTLPGLGRDEPVAATPGPKALPQHPEVDLAYSLQGVSARWEPTDRTKPGWSGWLPHLDLNIVHELAGTPDEERFRELIQQPGMLTLETKLDVRDLVQPAVQPGSKLDHEWPEEVVKLQARANRPITLDEVAEPFAPTNDPNSAAELGNSQQAIHSVSSKASQPVHLRLRMRTGDGLPSLQFESRVPSAGSTQPIALHRFILPWAATKFAAPESTRRPPIPELAGGSWGRGRRVFWSEEAGCAKCHAARGESGRIGPDLANLVHRDYASVLRDITQPSFALNPDYLSSIVSLKDGRVLTGTIRSDGDKLQVGDKDGKVHIVAVSDVEELQHSSISIMPEGVPKKLGPERMKDLLTFLLTEPPQMPWESPLPPPKPRSRAEVERVLARSESPGLPPRPVTVLLVAGAKDHGPGEHDYPAWLKSWKELLLGAEAVTVDTAMEWPTADQIGKADTIVFFQKGSWNAERAAAMDAHLARQGGLVYIHWAVEAGAEAPAFAQRIGLASNAAKLKFRHGPLDLGFETGDGHPIARNFDKVHFHDESYWQMQGDPKQIQVLATGIEDGKPQPLFWTLEPSHGRVFVSIPGHYSWTFDDPLFRILLLRGIAWSAREPVDRWNELSTLGVKMADGPLSRLSSRWRRDF